MQQKTRASKKGTYALSIVPRVGSLKSTRPLFARPPQTGRNANVNTTGLRVQQAAPSCFTKTHDRPWNGEPEKIIARTNSRRTAEATYSLYPRSRSDASIRWTTDRVTEQVSTPLSKQAPRECAKHQHRKTSSIYLQRQALLVSRHPRAPTGRHRTEQPVKTRQHKTK